MWTQKLFAHKHIHTQTVSQTETITHKHFYTQNRDYYTQTFLHTNGTREIQFFPQFLPIDPNFVQKGGSGTSEIAIFLSFSNRPSFRAKVFLPQKWNCIFTSVFADQPSFRSQGLAVHDPQPTPSLAHKTKNKEDEQIWRNISEKKWRWANEKVSRCDRRCERKGLPEKV